VKWLGKKGIFSVFDGRIVLASVYLIGFRISPDEVEVQIPTGSFIIIAINSIVYCFSAYAVQCFF
jgi:hypothetical protein